MIGFASCVCGFGAKLFEYHKTCKNINQTIKCNQVQYDCLELYGLMIEKSIWIIFIKCKAKDQKACSLVRMNLANNE